MTLESLFQREPPSVRASDADRERYIEILKRNCADGRITEEELSTRVDRALRAHTLGELAALIGDLPEGNVDPVAQLVGGVVRTGMQAARIGAWIGGGAALLGIMLPLVIGLSVTVSPLAGLIAAGAVILLSTVVVHRIRRR